MICSAIFHSIPPVLCLASREHDQLSIILIKSTFLKTVLTTEYTFRRRSKLNIQDKKNVKHKEKRARESNFCFQIFLLITSYFQMTKVQPNILNRNSSKVLQLKIPNLFISFFCTFYEKNSCLSCNLQVLCNNASLTS